MKKLFSVIVCLASSASFAASTSHSKSKPKTYEAPKATVHHSDSRSPWDFTAGLGLYNPGTGFGALGAYRIVDGLLPGNTQNDLSIEGGFHYVSFSPTVFNSTFSYSLIEIPIHARWDFYLMDGKMIVGPQAGLSYWTGYTSLYGSYGGNITVSLGGDAIYYFTDNFGARVDLTVGGYTTLMIGINYTP